MRNGGLTPSLPFVHTDEAGKPLATDVYLIPLEGFSVSAAADLARFLSEYYNISVKETAYMPLPEDAFDKDREQYVADDLYPYLYDCVKRLGSTNKNALYIALLAGDMYDRNSSWNFAFQLGYSGNISIIATDRMVPYGVTSRRHAEAIYGDRLSKMLIRTISERLYGIGRSIDPESVMYAPIMSVDDIDRMRVPKSGSIQDIEE